eukprot:1723853-Pyramimonas_sp.AAC.2
MPQELLVKEFYYGLVWQSLQGVDEPLHSRPSPALARGAPGEHFSAKKIIIAIMRNIKLRCEDHLRKILPTTAP